MGGILVGWSCRLCNFRNGGHRYISSSAIFGQDKQSGCKPPAILRGGSNYTMQPPGVSAAENLIRETQGFAGLGASLENVYRVGSVVMEEVLENWDRYRTEIPGQK